ncbi:MAG TPA: hypothetical protein VNM48_05790 [Chloroflexota bacterium]|nr:hypothetical protein [Chloroflexota bacterium]
MPSSTSTSSTHSLDTLVEDVAAYIEDSASYLAEAMLEDGRAPFEARLTEQERYDYFRGLLWNEDGTPNQEGRQHLMGSGGVDEYARVYRWVTARAKQREMRGSTRPPQDEPATNVEPDYDEDEGDD